MRTFGLIGFPLSHSFSQKYFTEKFKRENISDCEFRNFSFEDIKEFPSVIARHPTLRGLSVTIPHKQNVMPFLKQVDETAKQIGAVNCIRISDMKGFNTDAVGFENSLKPLLKPHHNRALILGSGGASKAIEYVLIKLNISYQVVSRSKGTFSYPGLNKEIISDHTVIINTTPLGMFPKVEECPPVPYGHLSSRHLLYDLTYNPEETLFLKKGKEKGAQIKNGLEMLHLQAEEAWRIWNVL